MLKHAFFLALAGFFPCASKAHAQKRIERGRERKRKAELLVAAAAAVVPKIGRGTRADMGREGRREWRERAREGGLLIIRLPFLPPSLSLSLFLPFSCRINYGPHVEGGREGNGEVLRVPLGDPQTGRAHNIAHIYERSSELAEKPKNVIIHLSMKKNPIFHCRRNGKPPRSKIEKRNSKMEVRNDPPARLLTLNPSSSRYATKNDGQPFPELRRKKRRR